MELKIKEWKEFRLGDIFDKLPIKKFNSIPENQGNFYFISSTSFNNGVTSKVAYDSNKTKVSNCITVSTNGECLDCFYQSAECYVSTDVEILKNNDLNEYHYLFLLPVIEKEKYRYSYGRKPKGSKVFDITIKLPSTNNNTPDWDYMEKYIKTLLERESSSYAERYLDGEQMTLDINNWKWFSLNKIFNIYTGDDIVINELETGVIPVVSHSHENNGISCYTTQLKRKIYNHKKCLSIAQIGSFKSFVQLRDFYIATRVKVLEFKNIEPNIYIMVFLCSILNKENWRYSYGRNPTGKLPYLEIKLPAKPDGSIDWDYMEKYIKQLPYSKYI